MTNFKIYLVSYDRLDERAVHDLSSDERAKLVCYTVNPGRPRFFQANLPVVREWDLNWYSPRYQLAQYFEYSAIVHMTKNPSLLDGLTHVGLMHYDMYFPKGSINEIRNTIESDPNTIMYVNRRIGQLYFTGEQLIKMCEYISERLNIDCNPDRISKDGWVSEALSVVPVNILTKFGDFILKYQYDIESMLKENRWNLMGSCNHRVCGIIERMWGMYLVSVGHSMKKLSVEHDWNSYSHEHQQMKNWI